MCMREINLSIAPPFLNCQTALGVRGFSSRIHQKSSFKVVCVGKIIALRR